MSKRYPQDAYAPRRTVLILESKVARLHVDAEICNLLPTGEVRVAPVDGGASGSFRRTARTNLCIN